MPHRTPPRWGYARLAWSGRVGIGGVEVDRGLTTGKGEHLEGGVEQRGGGGGGEEGIRDEARGDSGESASALQATLAG